MSIEDVVFSLRKRDTVIVHVVDLDCKGSVWIISSNLSIVINTHRGLHLGGVFRDRILLG